ncbi:MAG: bifunctional 5,10-methylene-tetrahydrofolate dehydrogenase/5,10-methylene-tetrahydrofolate cyclohydrolase [Bacteroidetes bacterium]|nr:bifunctional 5,10-methylene-tetrahydrofolate dehydrogenase/5,10-methylene-tetrahydrofolate cyclohydrolase [Bacteroidota bacterium]
MTAEIIDGKKIAEEIKNEVKRDVERMRASKGIVPGLAVILVGDNPASQSYVRSKGKACEEAGMYSVTERLPVDTPEYVLLEKIARFNTDPKIHGLLVQLPLPKHISEDEVIRAIDPRKDVDGFHPVNIGKLVIGQDTFKSATPAGIQELLIRSGNDPAGKHVVIVGRSNIVGKPVANMLLQKQKGANAVVTIAHTGAPDLRPYIKSADILIAAIGKPEFIKGEMLKEGAVVIDVGINRVEDSSLPKGYRIVGDVHFESASKVAKAITPVPGGVGLMTIAMLLKNTIKAANQLS